MEQQILFVLGSRTCVPEDPLVAARAMDLRSVVFTPRPPGCGTAVDLMDHLDYVDVRHPEQAVELARKVHRRSPIRGVLGYEEDATLMAAHIAAALGLPAHPVAAAEAAMDKPTMKRLFQRAGVPCADFIVAADEDEAVAWARAGGFPVVVKPCRGGASQGVIRADDEVSLRQAYRRLRRIVRDHDLDNGDRPPSAHLVERYLPGAEVSVELLLQYGAADVITEFGKPMPLTGPFFEETIYITPPTLQGALRKELHELAIAAAAALGFHHGPAHCEIRLTPDGPKVLEIAGRLLGGACARSFRDRLGGDVHTYMLRAAMGERVTLPPPASDAPVVGALMMPVPAEGRVVSVSGVDRARRVPGVWDVSMMAAPGETIIPFPEQSCYAVGFVSASGRDEADVVDSLSWAGSSIVLELAPVRADRWSAPVTAAPGPPPGHGALLEELAEVAFEELPAAEALSHARELLAVQDRQAGVHCHVRADGVGLLTGWVHDGTGHIGAGDAYPRARRAGGYRHAISELITALTAEFARHGATEAVIDVDPRRPALAEALAACGFVRQPQPPPEPGGTRTLSCALTPASCTDQGGSGDGGSCCDC
ncbi:ATP-grasp domain-containing protein [Nonomuraea endophytica]|uniref:ATP-grasp domain-containing protein n=1 Tax=Nonomuraea endophytica TaxID=714136 RepID=UPI0037C9FC71